MTVNEEFIITYYDRIKEFCAAKNTTGAKILIYPDGCELPSKGLAIKATGRYFGDKAFYLTSWQYVFAVDEECFKAYLCTFPGI